MNVIQIGDARRVQEFGPKAASLANLMKIGHAVPEGFVIGKGIKPREDIEKVAPKVFAALGNVTVAVRTSSAYEDLHTNSSAGFFLSVLGVASAEELAHAIGACLGHHDAAVGDSGVGAAIIIQRQVGAEFAGVAFSCNPVNGDRSVVLVEGVPGTADGLCDGKESPERYFVPKAALNSRRGDQPTRRAGGLLFREVALQAYLLERELGRPVDIEWAQDGFGRIWLVQERPIASPLQTVDTLPSLSRMADA